MLAEGITREAIICSCAGCERALELKLLAFSRANQPRRSASRLACRLGLRVWHERSYSWRRRGKEGDPCCQREASELCVAAG